MRALMTYMKMNWLKKKVIIIFSSSFGAASLAPLPPNIVKIVVNSLAMLHNAQYIYIYREREKKIRKKR